MADAVGDGRVDGVLGDIAAGAKIVRRAVAEAEGSLRALRGAELEERLADSKQSYSRSVEELAETAEVDVEEAKNGQEGLDILAKNPDINVIITDLRMPGIDGFEVCRRLKADPATASIPVIFLSAKASSMDRIKGLKMGVTNLLIL